MDDLPEGLAASGAVKIAGTIGTMDAGRVLDVGTGNGDFITTLMEILGDHSTFTGVDVNSEKLEEGRERFEGKPVDLIEMDGRDLSFEDGTFDTVCISNSLHHLEHVGDVLSEMVRVLRPGGHLVLQEMFSDGEQSPAQTTDSLQHHWSARVDTLFGTYHRETYQHEEIRSAVEGLDLREVTFFEATRGIKCLTCEDRFRCEDPFDPEFMSNVIDEIEEDLERLQDLPDAESRDALVGEGLAMEERVRKTGVLPASTLFVIGRK